MANKNIGKRARDNITGFEGIIISAIDHLHGCIQYAIKPNKLDKEGKPMAAVWFDEGQVEILKKPKKYKPKKTKSGKTGGPVKDFMPVI